MFVKFYKVIDKTYCAVFLWYNKCLRSPLGAANFIYDLKSLESVEFLFEREFMCAWNRKIFSMIWFHIWFKFNIIGLIIPCAYITTKQGFTLL